MVLSDKKALIGQSWMTAICLHCSQKRRFAIVHESVWGVNDYSKITTVQVKRLEITLWFGSRDVHWPRKLARLSSKILQSSKDVRIGDGGWSRR